MSKQNEMDVLSLTHGSGENTVNVDEVKFTDRRNNMARTSTQSKSNKTNPAAIEAVLKKEQTNDKEKGKEGSKPAPAPATAKAEKKHDERFLSISMQTYVNAITAATGFKKQSLNLELAVCLSVYAQYGKADLQAKKDLYQIYSEAGYKTADPEGDDYKTVNRRINAAAALFDHIGGKATVDDWTVATHEMQTIQAIINRLTTEYDFKSINGVMAMVGRPIVSKREAKKADEGQKGEQQHQQPNESDKALAARVAGKVEENRAGAAQKTEAQYNRRLTDSPNCYIVKTDHLHVAIPYDVPAAELIQLATELLHAANTLQMAETDEEGKEEKEEHKEAVAA